MPGQCELDAVTTEKAALIDVLIDIKSGVSLVEEGLYKVLQISRFPITERVEPRNLQMWRLFGKKRLDIEISPVARELAQREFEGQSHAFAQDITRFVGRHLD